MGLVTGITKTIPVPGEDETVVIRRLNHAQLKEASKNRQSESVTYMKELGGELLKAMRDPNDDPDKTAERLKKIQERQEADIDNYDRNTLLRYGVVSWTYPIPPIAVAASGVTDGLNELDEPTAKYLAKEIFDFSRPSTEAEAKNG